MFEECVAPLVDGLFQGYNATVLAYGQVKYCNSCLSSFYFSFPFFGMSHYHHNIHVSEALKTFEISDVLQTGSGKTYTMGTSCRDGSHTGLIPQVLNALFDKIDTLKNQVEFQLRVSFIEVQEMSLPLLLS